MATRPILDPATERAIDLFLARVRPRYPVVEAWLYGSRARGDAREDSDVDIALVLDEPKRRSSPVAADLGGDGFDVLTETGRFVSATPIWIEDWRLPSNHSNPWLLKNIQREGQRL